MKKIETYLENYKYKLSRKIAKFHKMMTLEEFTMLNTLNNNLLLLDIDRELINEREYLTAYNIERKLILLKEILENEKNE